MIVNSIVLVFIIAIRRQNCPRKIRISGHPACPPTDCIGAHVLGAVEAELEIKEAE